MNVTPSQHSDYALYSARLAAAGRPYERRHAPDLSGAIEQIAAGLEHFKSEQRAKLELLETRLSRPGGPGSSAGVRPVDPMFPQVTPEQRAALARWVRSGDPRAFEEARGREMRASVTATSGDGANAVISWFNQRIQSQAMENSELLRRVAQVTSPNFPVKTIVSTEAAFEWVGESSARNDTDAPQPKVIEIPAGEWSAKPAVSNWALADIAFDVESWLTRELSIAFTNGLMAAVVLGDGTNKPTGILAAPVSSSATPELGTIRYFPTGAASTLPTTADAMLTLLTKVSGSLAWQYRGDAVWLMNASTLEVIRAVRDTVGRPLFMDSLVMGGTNQLLGYPVVEVEAMPNIGADAFPIAFGSLNAGYLLASDAGMRLTRDEITTPGFTKYYTRTRVGGKPTDTAALRLVKVATT